MQQRSMSVYLKKKKKANNYVLSCALRLQLPANTKDTQDAQKQDKATRLAAKFPGNNSSRVSIIYVTVTEKRAQFGQYFKIELLVLKGRVALSNNMRYIFCRESNVLRSFSC